MTFVFWQNIISIHQKAFLEALVKQPGVSRVSLVVAHDLSPVRKNMGWDVPQLENVEVIMSPSVVDIKTIVSINRNAVHVLGGIRIGTMIIRAFDECIKQKCRIGIMTESYNSSGFKGMMRGFKYKYYKTGYFRNIQFILAIGKEGVAQYTRLGYNIQHLFPWAYFVTLDQQSKSSIAHSPGAPRIIYAGRLEEAKGIFRFVYELADVAVKDFKLDIYGEGPDVKKIRKLIVAKGISDIVSVNGFIKHNDLLEKYKEYDWVVLPSTQKDGWGVIISEGLLNGLKAICSTKCGVSWVIKERINGVTFDWSDEGSCKNAIGKMLAGEGFADADTISKWADRTLSGEAGAEYFMRIMDCVYNNKEKPGIPWLGNL